MIICRTYGLRNRPPPKDTISSIRSDLAVMREKCEELEKKLDALYCVAGSKKDE